MELFLNQNSIIILRYKLNRLKWCFARHVSGKMSGSGRKNVMNQLYSRLENEMISDYVTQKQASAKDIQMILCTILGKKMLYNGEVI